MDNLPPSIKEKCQDILGTSVLSSQYIGGGDINHARLIETASNKYFLKYNTVPSAFTMFKKEALGLEILREPGVIFVPEVLAFDQSDEGAFLILEFVETGVRPRDFWSIFGRQLADLHKVTNDKFGLDHSNFIGSLPQNNNFHSTWAEFYIRERLIPQIELAYQKQRIQTTDNQYFEKLFKRIPDLCPIEPPSLTHGDLWSGNFMVHKSGKPVLIDPSVSFAHREMDIAMTMLFGGFDSEFYPSYREHYPLEPDFNQRVELYQLYYLMVHVNLFGGGYLNSVRRILKRFE